MDKILIYWDKEGETLHVWFDDPQNEHVCEETGDDVILVKDRAGHVIGFERLNFHPSEGVKLQGQLPVEVQVA